MSETKKMKNADERLQSFTKSIFKHNYSIIINYKHRAAFRYATDRLRGIARFILSFAFIVRSRSAALVYASFDI